MIAHAGDETYAARWLVGCDGGRSAVRGLAGFGFMGTEPQFTGYLMLASGPDLDRLEPGFNLTPAGMYLRMPTPGHLGIMDFDGGAYDRSLPPTRQHLQAVLRRVSGIEVTLTEVPLVSTFTDRAMQATGYRRGRVLLAGDAAHIHSPLGGQGLNLGLGDALNLGWKLAATIHGNAPRGLLDTYTTERHPVGAQVLDWSRAQVAVMAPGPHADALQSVMRDLLTTRDGTTYAFSRISGAGVDYNLGDGSLVGRSSPAFQLTGGSHLGELLQDGRGVLLDLTPDLRLSRAAEVWKDGIRYVTGPVRDDLGLSAVLVRPDGFVAWASAEDPRTEEFETAAATWFGSRTTESLAESRAPSNR